MENLNMSNLNLLVTAGCSSQNDCSAALVKEDPSQDLDGEFKCEYRQDIWQTLLQLEAENPPINMRSPQLEYRGTLVQMLREVTKKLGLSIATLHSAVAQLDLFMDAHRLRSDRLLQVALACLSLAAKSDEKFSQAPSLKILSLMTGLQITGDTFKTLEWMIGDHVRWRLLAPTPATFAAMLAHFVVTETDLITRNSKVFRRMKKNGTKLLRSYLDLTLSDVRLKLVRSVDVGCACVASARTDLKLCAWPQCLANASGRQYSTIGPIARRLQRMMEILNSRENADLEADQGYGSARTSPNITPCTSPKVLTSSAVSTCSFVNVGTGDTAYQIAPVDRWMLGGSTSIRPTVQLPANVVISCVGVENPTDNEHQSDGPVDSLGTVQPSTSAEAVKRTIDSNIDEIENKKLRLSSQVLN